MKQYVEGATYIVYVREFGLPASDKTRYHVRAKCVGGNDLDVGYFVDAEGNSFNSGVQSATLENEFIWDREIVDKYPFAMTRTVNNENAALRVNASQCASASRTIHVSA